jgi:xanthine dehydrogenase YagR molybdenum-binding subunit
LPLQDDRVWYEGQHIGIVVAESLEQAQYAARLVQIDYAVEPAEVDFHRRLDAAIAVDSWAPADGLVGDVEAGLAAADVRVEATYTTANRHHNPMELSGTIAEWHADGTLTLYDATQHVWGVRAVLADVFGLRPEAVRVRNDFVGGGFGAKGYIWPHPILAAMAARSVGRPVKLSLTRAQAYTSHGYQPATVQTITLGATTDGHLTALRHASVSPTAETDDHVELAGVGSHSLYACPAIETHHRVVRVNTIVPTPMRAPHEGPGLVGLEIAMDELAYALRIDPLELRLRNYAERDPTHGLPFSSKKLRECYLEGAERFGWARRSPEPGSMRDGHDLIGWGLASVLMSTFRMPANARVTIDRRGDVVIEAGCQEIGTGAYTIMPQIAADALGGIDPERVQLRLGDTTLPETGGTFGSSTTLSVGSAVHDAATKLRSRLLALAEDDVPPDPDRYGEILERVGLEQLAAEGAWSPEHERYSMHSFGAIFVEVGVDRDLRLPRLRRAVGVYSAGRIINPTTARSQMTGGIIWGLGQALLEASEVDRNLGRFVSKNLAGYLVPVNADVPDLDVHFVDEVDAHASAIGARGIGELGAVGVGAAIANAVFHATGIRVRDLPIRPEALLT